MRAIVAEKLDEGWSEQQIQEFFVERYGPSVLLEPQRRGFTLMVWIIPPVALVGAGIVLYLALRLMRRSPAGVRRDLGEEVRLSDDERHEYFQRIEATLDDNLGAVTQVRGDVVPPPGNRGRD